MSTTAASLPQSTTVPQGQLEKHDGLKMEPDWMRIGVGATLIAGSLLLLSGKRKAGLVVTAAGTALAMLEHREVVSEWWEKFPQHLQKVQHMLDQTQETIEDLTNKRDKVMALFGR